MKWEHKIYPGAWQESQEFAKLRRHLLDGPPALGECLSANPLRCLRVLHRLYQFHLHGAAS